MNCEIYKGRAYKTPSRYVTSYAAVAMLVCETPVFRMSLQDVRDIAAKRNNF